MAENGIADERSARAPIVAAVRGKEIRAAFNEFDTIP